MVLKKYFLLLLGVDFPLASWSLGSIVRNFNMNAAIALSTILESENSFMIITMCIINSTHVLSALS